VALIQIDHNPSRKNLLWFGLLLGLFLTLIGAIARLRFGTPWIANGFFTAAVAITISYYLVPPIRKPVYLAWMCAAFPIGFVMSYVILAVTYFAVFTPIALLLRLLRRDPLERKFDRAATTYWTPHRPAGKVERYFRQF